MKEEEQEERLKMNDEVGKLKISTDSISIEEIKKTVQETKAGKARESISTKK
jgi:hypothetical protein